MNKLLLLFVLTSILFTCSTGEKEGSGFLRKYNIKICYYDCYNRLSKSSFENSFSKDSLYVFIEEGFKGDTVTVYFNQRKYFEKVLSSNPIVGLSDVAKHSLTGINSIGVRMNNGNLALIEINQGTNFLNVNFKDSTLTVSVLDNVPFYD